MTAFAAVVAYRRRLAGRRWILAAFAPYAAAFVITMGVSVPLNDQLAAAGPVDGIADPAAVRATCESTWAAWNITRAALSTAALAALVCAIFRSAAPVSERVRSAST